MLLLLFFWILVGTLAFNALSVSGTERLGTLGFSPESQVGKGTVHRGRKQRGGVKARAAQSEDEVAKLSTIIAHLQNGGDVRTQLESFAGCSFALPSLKFKYIFEAFDSSRWGSKAWAEHARKGDSEDREGREISGLGTLRAQAATAKQVQSVVRISERVLACCRLSDDLGCAMAVSLGVVKHVCVAERHVEDLRSKAYSMPRATVKLLAALPLVTLAGGQVLGAHPFSFLVGSPVGWGCASVGALFFAAGQVWMNRLLRQFGSGA